MKNISLILTIPLLLIGLNVAFAGENRYQAHWNGKLFLIVDSDDGHLWTFRNDSLIYNGQIDGDQFVPPEKPQVWQQKHGKWTKNN